MTPRKNTPKTTDELMERVLDILPDAEPYTDDDTKELCFRSGFTETDNGELERLYEDDDENEFDDDDLLGDDFDDNEED